MPCCLFPATAAAWRRFSRDNYPFCLPSMGSEGIQLEGANEWEMHIRGYDGRPYFYNSRTRESTWKPPHGMTNPYNAAMMGGFMIGSQGAATGGSVPLDRHGSLFVLRLVLRRVRASVCSSQHRSELARHLQAGNFAGRLRAAAAC